MPDHSGMVIVDKPAGMTSHDVVNRLRRALGTRRVGHAGTLDPSATGVLVVGVGSATRLLHFLQPLAKAYRTEVRFGVTTTTQDAEGEILEQRTCTFDRSDLAQQAAGFVGEIEQVPPMVSAVKVGGEPLYRAARRGETVERPARKVRVYELEVEAFSAAEPSAKIFVRVSGGTYIRTIVADLGERLGCGAHVTSLRRLSVGSFDEGEALTLEEVERLGPQSLSPASTALRDFPSLTVDKDEERAVRSGRPLPDTSVRSGEIPVITGARAGSVPPHLAGMTAGIPVAILDGEGNLLAVYRRTRGVLRAAAVLAGGQGDGPPQ